MPYTPPSQLSPATSKQSTPTPSRSHSYIHNNVNFGIPPSPVQESFRPQLPRSAGSSSYLSKHRRSPSLPTGNELPTVMTDFQRGIAFDPHGSLRQSPPPVTNGLIPQGMTISPPDSLHNSDDEELRGRSRELEEENLAALQDAIRGMKGERKSGSPVRKNNHDRSSVGKAASEGSSPQEEEKPRPPLSSSQRKISHSKSNTESNIVFEPPKQTLISPRYTPESDTDDSDGPVSRPPMVRKKSGELVKPALRPHSRRRPSSMPGTPTYSKAVHFDSQLEHIRHFLQVDRPLAVSAGSSPADNYESESEFPFGSEEGSTRPRGVAFEWEIKLANFPPSTDDRKHQPIHVERVFLAADNKTLVGCVAVQNLAFQKSVVARFTFDYWKTTSEVAAEFSNDLRKRDLNDGVDHFNFHISLNDQVNLENKTLFFCVRYAVNGTEYWDSNNMVNYQVDFLKKPKPRSNATSQAHGLGARPLNSLPRSRPSPPTSGSRPKSMPVSFDDFASGFDNFGSSFVQAPAALIGEPQIKLRSPRSKQELVPDAPARRNKPSAPMFGHRYDFNSSLNAAKNNAYAALGEDSGLTPSTTTKHTSHRVPASAVKFTQSPPQTANGTTNAGAIPSAPAMSAPVKPAALFSEKPPLTSQSYQELVEKYCFFGTTKVSATSTAGVNGGSADGYNSDRSSNGSASSSVSSSPLLDHPSSTPPSDTSTMRPTTPLLSRSASPLPFSGSCSNSRSSSPALLASTYLQTFSQTLLAEAPQATAIHG